MTEVEDVARTFCGALKNSAGLAANLIRLGKEPHRVQVALHADPLPKTRPGLTQVYTPIQSDHIPAGIPHQWEQRGRVSPEVNDPHPRRPRCDYARRIGQDKLA